jgi:hypothetical protein
MKLLRVIALAAVLIGGVPGSAHAASGYDVADLWWNPSESGWGMQLVQQSSTVFATLFVYDQFGVPIWYTATLNFTGLNASNGPVYSGVLYETRGPYFATPPFNPDLVAVVPVGSLTFSSPSTSTALLIYSVRGVTVTKNVQRQTLVNENFNGSYTGVYAVTRSSCSNPLNNGSQDFLTAFTIVQAGPAMTISASTTNGVAVNACTFNGAYSQTGSIGGFSGTYSCSDGESGTISFAEMTAQRFAISGRLSGGRNNLGCNLSGSFAAVQ